MAEDDYSTVRTSDVETLLIGGEVDFAAPPQGATEELLPHLPNGHQVVLPGFGHSTSFFADQPEAGTRLINTYLASGEVDDSLYEPRSVDFTPEVTQTALGKGVGGDVAAYAQMMIDEHTRNREQTSAFEPDEASAEAQAQKAKGEQELEALGRMEGDAYAKAYIDAMVKGHTEALDALDNRIIPAATRPEVKAHLDTTRGHVAQHLERAKALQGG